MLRIRRHLLCCAVILVSAALLCGQTDRSRSLLEPATLEPATLESPRFLPPPRPQPGRPPISAPISLPQVIRSSGTIFAGTVTAIAHSPSSSRNALPTVAITLRVTEGVQGAVTGQDFTLHEWIGLWNSGQQRYRVGEKVFLFLYPSSKLGLTSSVAGSLGRLPIDNVGRLPLSPQHISLFRTHPKLGGRPNISIEDLARAVRQARLDAWSDR